LSHPLTIIDDDDVATADIVRYEASRRDLLRRGIAWGGATLVASSVPSLLVARDAFAEADDEAGILKAAIGLEEVAVFAYRYAAHSGALDAAFVPVAKLFAEQEEYHRDAMKIALEQLGGGSPPVAPKRSGDTKLLAPLAKAKTQAAIANYAIELETTAVGAYYDAHLKLQNPRLLKTCTQIMANEGQHLAVLRALAGKPPVPNAFETGGANA
jgi:rubrerythrin